MIPRVGWELVGLLIGREDNSLPVEIVAARTAHSGSCPLISTCVVRTMAGSECAARPVSDDSDGDWMDRFNTECNERYYNRREGLDSNED